MSQVTLQQAIDLALQHHNRGELQQAEAIYQQVLAAFPEQPDALHLMGVLAFQCNQPQLAADFIRRAIVAYPDDANFHYNLGQILLAGPNRAQAVDAYRRAVALKPDYADAWNNLAALMVEAGQIPEGIAAYRRAIEINPNSAAYQANLSNALREDNQLEEAAASAKRATEIDPSFASGHNNLGAAILRLGRHDEAIASYRRAISLDPNLAMAHYNLAMALLLQGHLAEAWPEMEWRWKTKELDLAVQELPHPRWDGSNLNGKRIFLQIEQGFGDAIHFVRYVPQVIAKGGRVILGVSPELVRLMRCVEELEMLVTDGDPIPQFDLQCPLLSLPGIFRTTLETIPAPIPYLQADPTLVEEWKAKLGPDDGRRKVGLVWAGRPEHKNDRNRSLSLQQLAPLATAPGVRWINLQMGPPAQQITSAPNGMEFFDAANGIKDFADSAAIMMNLDLLISVDTAAVHLAGALGKPAWTLLPFTPDWRWMLGRSDSPWYPTIRLYRQPMIGDWSTPIAQLAADLRRTFLGS